jgi:peptidoglycan/LPS O-acetylase OafA/YrhL
MIPNIGMLSVNYFYVISGFLITMVLNEVYKFNLIPFAKNRALRLYPAYLAVSALSAALYFVDGFSSFHVTWSPAPSTFDAVKNITLLPFAFIGDSTNFVNFLGLDFLENATNGFRLIPPSWSVAIEVCCYGVLWLVTARSVVLTILTIGISAAWHVYAYFHGLPELYRYAPIPAALLPFALGAMAYHLTQIYPQIFRASRSLPVQILFTIGCIAAFLANWYETAINQSNFLSTPYYYTNTALAFASMLLINKSRTARPLSYIDKLLGDLAYPLFLCHFAAGFIAAKLFGIDSRGWTLFATGYTVALIISLIIVKLIDDPVSKLRDRVRANPENLQAVVQTTA